MCFAGKTVWIVGSSIVHWAGIFARSRRGGPSLGLQRRNVTIKWFGTPGMRWEQLTNFVEKKLADSPPPNYMVIHLGSNDLTNLKTKDLICNIECSILRLRTLYPQIKLIWSDILQRCYWHGALSQVNVEGTRKRINRAAKSIMLKENGCIIRHNSITVKEISLFRHDGVHLTNSGNAIFINDVQGGVESCIFNGTRIFPDN